MTVEIANNVRIKIRPEAVAGLDRPEELAAKTGMNENTIKVKLFRARQKLVKAAQRLDRAPGLVAG